MPAAKWIVRSMCLGAFPAALGDAVTPESCAEDPRPGGLRWEALGRKLRELVDGGAPCHEPAHPPEFREGLRLIDSLDCGNRPGVKGSTNFCAPGCLAFRLLRWYCLSLAKPGPGEYLVRAAMAGQMALETSMLLDVSWVHFITWRWGVAFVLLRRVSELLILAGFRTAWPTHDFLDLPPMFAGVTFCGACGSRRGVGGRMELRAARFLLQAHERLNARGGGAPAARRLRRAFAAVRGAQLSFRAAREAWSGQVLLLGRDTVNVDDPHRDVAALLSPVVVLLAGLADRMAPGSDSARVLGVAPAVGPAGFLLSMEPPGAVPNAMGPSGLAAWPLLFPEGGGDGTGGGGAPADPHLRYFLGHLHEFYGRAGAPEEFLRWLAARTAEGLPLARDGAKPWLMQAGAGLCTEERGNLVALLVELFGGCGAVDVLGIDPMPPHLADLRSDTARRLVDTSCVSFLEAALSSFEGSAGLFGHGAVRSIRPTGLALKTADGALVGEGVMPRPVAVTRLRSLVASRFGAERPHLELLIIDTEGQEWEVLRGLLDDSGEEFVVRPAVIILEYGVLWSPTTRAAQQPTSTAVNATARSVEAMEWPTLKGVSQWFERRGYVGFLLGTRRLVPLSQSYWHDAYEVCRAPHAAIYRGLRALYNGWCWFDAVFIEDGHPLLRQVWERTLQPEV